MPSNEPQFDRDTQLKLAEVQLGFEAQDFLRTKIGRYLLGRAEHEAALGMERLKKADPTDAHEIRAAQTQANVPELFLRWLQDAIVNGRNAEAEIEAGNHTD